MDKKIYIIFLLFCSILQCTHSKCSGQPNTVPITPFQPKFINHTTNGERYLVGSLQNEGNFIHIAKIKGSAYEMGKAFGELFHYELKEQLKNFFAYYSEMIKEAIQQQKIPAFLKKIIVKSTPEGINALMDINIQITRKYTNKRYFEEIQGIADGAKINSKIIARMNILPQLVKAACTVAGVWNSASENRKTLHMRALDWDSQNPINKFPIAIVYHPSGSGLFKHINFAWVGFVGSLTGFSQKISIGEKVWLPPKNSVKMTRFGNPWTYVLRDVLYEASDMKDAIAILSKARRTCAIHLGLGSRDDQTFRMFQYSQNILNNYNDANYTKYTQNHPKKQGIAYFDKHVQPSNDDCVGSLLTNNYYYGNWNLQNFWRVVGAMHQTGNTQLVVFNLQDQTALISYSRTQNNKTQNAFNRSPIFIDIKQLWTQF